MKRPARWLDRFTFGGRMPAVVGLLMAATVVASLVGAFGGRHGLPLFAWGALAPERVWRGEVWRLVTWVFLEPDPLGLLFTCLLLFWFGRDLDALWGSARLLRVYLGVGLAAAAGTCLIARADQAVMGSTYLSSWPVATALTVAWGLCHPYQEILAFFFLRMRGAVLAWVTMAAVVVFAIYFGWEAYLPSLLAIAAMLAWLLRGRVAARWARRRRDARAAAAKTVRRLDALDEEAPPPMPTEVESVLDRILDDVGREQRARRAQRKG